jgi:molybdopterin-guanine dinucleotide biosynthesis protein A
MTPFLPCLSKWVLNKLKGMDALILAGGENRRIPFIKAFLQVEGRSIIESNVELLKGIFDRVIISTNDPEIYFYLGVLLVGDVMEERGPMTGILSAMNLPGAAEVFVTACDMPFINGILTRYMIDRWESGREALIPVFKGKPQPLFGIYSRKIAVAMEESIRRGYRGLIDFLGSRDVLYIEEKEVRNIDAEGRSFVNINTIDDVKREGGKICLV